MAQITTKYVLDHIRGKAPTDYGLEIATLVAKLKTAHVDATPQEMKDAVEADKGKSYPKLFESIAKVDKNDAYENAKIAKLRSRMRSVKSALIKDQPLELFPVFETVIVNVGTSTKRLVVFAHEAVKVPSQRDEIARRYQFMEKNGKAGIVKVKKFVMLMIKQQYTPPAI